MRGSGLGTLDGVSSPESFASTEMPSTATRVTTVVAIAGSMLMCVSLFLEWGNDVVFAASATAKGAPLYLVWNNTGTGAGVALMWPLLLCSLVALGGSVLHRFTTLAIAAAAVSALLCFLYLNAIKTRLSDGFDDFGSASLGKAVGIGAWMFGAASLVVLVALVVRLRVNSIAAQASAGEPVDQIGGTG